jgi:branched-chain amino acid transport system substrate-binding protein
MHKFMFRSLFCISFLLFSTLILTACFSKPPILIGLSGEFSGKQSELAIQMRNGVILAVEEVNAAGGINGRTINLLTENDLGTPEGAQNAENKIIDGGAVATIGHFTSNQTVEGYKVAAARGVLLFSPTAATSLLSDKKDLFFRVISSTDTIGKGFAKYIYQTRKLSRIAIIYDLDNNTYSDPMAQAFSKTISELGGQVSTVEKFSSKTAPDFTPLLANLRQSNPEGVLIIAAPNNVATIAQLIRLENWLLPLFSAPWGQSEALIQNGGKAVEGLELLVPFDINASTPRMEDFKTRYEKRFVISPAYTAVYGYETAQILFAALKKTNGEAKNLPNVLIETKDYTGLTGAIHMNEYGDVSRDLYVQRINHTKFETVFTLTPD